MISLLQSSDSWAQWAGSTTRKLVIVLEKYNNFQDKTCLNNYVFKQYFSKNPANPAKTCQTLAKCFNKIL